ncbi:alpha/beta hydrolase family protein [Alkalihalobacillus sp. 1P02AB]|uniref:alpha/beta hydrolase family protein n=1 Tax=Alkalihalobacillus sp. 1P02AB TaxID=3132260 RepID=UPI0039A726BD
MKREREFHIQGLAALLTIPEIKRRKHPLIIMIHGSGPLDRNGNATWQKLNVFNHLSDELVLNGYATLRYDKRGVGKSDGDYYQTGLYDLIEDATTIVQFAKKQKEIDLAKIILLGHSEGCMIAPAVYTRERVSGLILLAGLTESLEEAMAWQREQMTKELEQMKGIQGKVVRFLKVAKKLESNNEHLAKKIKKSEEDVIRFKGRKIQAKWLREHLDFDVKKALQQVQCPVLAITGTKDVQVKPEQIKEVAALVRGECETHLINHLTHMLRKTSKEHKMNVILKDYKKQVKKPIDPELVDKVNDWLKRYFSQR